MQEIFDVLKENGEYTNKTATREECHEKGLWHRATVVVVMNSKNQILLQQRSKTKKLWSNMWDVSAGGHVLVGEFSYNTAIRETKEEIGLDITEKDLLFIGSSCSTKIQGDIIDNHFNEYFIVTKDMDISKLELQTEEVQDIKWFGIEDLLKRIHNNYEGITDKTGCWTCLAKYLETR
ncbi:MAG: NUDIX domain-containing protein [Oscillospiraceae bacterium]|nr:NUDIX domain-containing protein [Oscillospiraceae bacterium]